MNPETISIPTQLAFDLLEKIRFSQMYICPPDDWREEKWDTPEEFVTETLQSTYKQLFSEMEKQIEEANGKET